MTKLMEVLLMPPALPVWLLLIGMITVWFRRRLGLGLLLAGGVMAYVSSLPLVASLMAAGLQAQPPVSSEQIAEFEPQWIVVLAGGKDTQRPDWGGETLSRYSLSRLRYAARMARQTSLPVLASGGSTTEEGQPESVLMRDMMRDEFGIQRVAAETESRSTRENAVHSATALRANGATRILLVTHAVHMRRAEAAFVRLGVAVLPAPTAYFNTDIDWADPMIWVPDHRAIESIAYALHERLGYWWYDWQGWVVNRPATF